MEGRPSSGHSTNKCREPKHGRRAEFEGRVQGQHGRSNKFDRARPHRTL